MCKKVVVFDLDDTLYKEIDFLKSAYRHIASLVSNANAQENEVYQTLLDTYMQGGNAFETVVKKFNFQLFSVEWMLDVYRHHQPHIQLDSDIKQTLEALKAKGVFLGIISDGRRKQQENKIKALGLKAYIPKENMVVNEVKGRFKPDRQSFKFFMEKYGKDCDFWYVGDNTFKDFVAPNTLGWTTVCLIDDGSNIHKQNFQLESPFMPKLRIKLLSELLDGGSLQKPVSVFVNGDTTMHMKKVIRKE